MFPADPPKPFFFEPHGALYLRLAYLFLIVPALLLASPPTRAQLVPGSLDVHWNEGSSNCAANPQPPLQVHPYNSQAFILREGLCTTFEAPFLYLLIGSTRLS
jgi:hydroxyacylglutathione hydrolase